MLYRQTNLQKPLEKKSCDECVHACEKGEIYGFLGPNGAGKTTVMKLLTNLWKPTEGSIELFGEKLTSTSYDVLKRMGCMIEFPTFYEHLSGRENLALHCEYMGYYNTGSIENAMELLGLNNTGKNQYASILWE